jgi:hypothetical protein
MNRASRASKRNGTVSRRPRTGIAAPGVEADQADVIGNIFCAERPPQDDG